MGVVKEGGESAGVVVSVKTTLPPVGEPALSRVIKNINKYLSPAFPIIFVIVFVNILFPTFNAEFAIV
jgi:hypothetical protein